MIARPQALAADPVAAVLAEAVAAASAALYVVLADDDESALAELDFEAVVAVQLEHVVAAAQEAANVGRDIIMCGPVGPAVRSELVARVPTATLRFLDVQSPASALGYVGTVTCWSDADRARLRATWLKIAAEARIDRAPTADRGVPFEPKEPDAAPWPEPLSSAVRIGLVGDFLDLVEEQTEADPAAILTDLLVRIGNAVGRGPHFTVSGDRHGCNLFAAIVGPTAQGRKGSSAAFPRRLLELADPAWAETRVLNGLSSGEGVAWGVRDAQDTGRSDKDGNPIVDPGVTDKRLLCIETELARTLRAASRRDSTLGPILRQAWDGTRLASMTKTPYRASDAHVSLLAHVTGAEFLSLVKADDIRGGTINRFLFAASRRQRSLPFGGEVDEVAFAGLAARLQRCLARARERAGVMRFSPLAQEVWPSLYERLQADEKAPGMAGELLGRAVAQVRRLAMVFAVVDEQEHVDVRHLDAAAELWRYHVDTVRRVFGDGTGNRVADRILGELRGNPEQGIDRTTMHKLFDRHVAAADIDTALALLHQLRLAEGRKTPTGGRPRETWFPIARSAR